MKAEKILITILNYPGAMISAVYGLAEVLQIANQIAVENQLGKEFSTNVVDIEEVKQSEQTEAGPQVVFIPPDLAGNYSLNPDQYLLNWLTEEHKRGAIICSACAGAFILASTGLLNKRVATTHWVLAEGFSEKFPDVQLESNKILINDGDVITAGGLMSWLDLALELVGQIMNQNIMRQLGKYLVIDTGQREQRYYEGFSPKLDHGDLEILKAQRYMQANLHKTVTVSDLSALCFLTERTFLRRFVKATKLKPIKYLQKLRVQKSCELIETTNDTFDSISYKVGYADVSAFRKIFIKIIGLTPREFKSRFVI